MLYSRCPVATVEVFTHGKFTECLIVKSMFAFAGSNPNSATDICGLGSTEETGYGGGKD